MPLIGRKAHVARLKRISGPEMERAVGAALFAAGELIQADAQISIVAGSVSGKNHVASAPGEAPNANSRTLDNAIETVQVEPLVVEVSSNAPYSTALERGTSRMEARPFLGPARDRKRKDAQQLVARAVKRVVARSGR